MEPEPAEPGPSTSGAPKQKSNAAQEEWWKSDDDSDGVGDDYDSDDDEAPHTGPPDPLYDPEADAQDEDWVVKQREGRVSDAILNCPGCFTTLCFDCQQHEQYPNQFRAMFVMNCRVMDKALQGSHAHGHAGTKRGREEEDEEGGAQHAAQQTQQGSGDMCYAVACDVCGTEVGAVDSDEIYHFYNVFPSNA